MSAAAATAQAPTRKRPYSEAPPFVITGADGAPIEVPAGEFYFNTKARCKRIMTCPLPPLGQQVHAYLELKTMGFQQEDAVTIDKGNKRRYVTTTDIGRDIGHSEQNARKGLAQVEAAGLAGRRSDDGGPLRKGHVIISAWAFPRDPKDPDSACARAECDAVNLPESWKPVQAALKRFRLNFAITDDIARNYKDDFELAARVLKEGDLLVRALAEKIGAQTGKADAYKEERTERTSERTGERAAFSTSVEEAAEEPKEPPAPPFEPDLQEDEPTEEEMAAAVAQIRATPESRRTDADRQFLQIVEEGEQAEAVVQRIEKQRCDAFTIYQTLDQSGLPVAPGDPILRKFNALPTEYDVPAECVAMAIRQKAIEKHRRGDPIQTAGGMLLMLTSGDLAKWIAANRIEIGFQRQISGRAAPFDPGFIEPSRDDLE